MMMITINIRFGLVCQLILRVKNSRNGWRVCIKTRVIKTFHEHTRGNARKNKREKIN